MTEKTIYYDGFVNPHWSNDAVGWANVQKQFEMAVPEPDEVLFAAYEYENYEGNALVLYRNEGKLWRVEGGHCSCHGLEGQWEPEETTEEAVLHQLSEGHNWGIWARYAVQIADAVRTKPKGCTIITPAEMALHVKLLARQCAIEEGLGETAAEDFANKCVGAIVGTAIKED